MSEFSELFQKLVDKSRCSISKLSSLSGVERTSIQKFLSGSRIPRKSHLEAMLPFLEITSAEKQAILRCYEEERAGKDVVRTRTEFLQMLKDNRISREDALRVGVVDEPSVVDAGGTRAISGRIELFQELTRMTARELRDAEEPELFMNCFKANEYVLQELLSLGGIDKRVTLHVAFDFYRGETDAQAGFRNISMLHGFLPFIFAWGGDFDLRYGYRDGIGADPSTLPFPNYLLTSSELLLMGGQKAEEY